MSLTVETGPLVIIGQNPPAIPGGTPDEYNPDLAPSVFSMGVGLIDPRFGQPVGGTGNGSAQCFAFAPAILANVLNQAPSTAATANIAALANVASGVAMTLVAASGAGITKMTSALAIKPTGLTVPACLAIDGLPGFVAFGQSSAIQFYDPTTMLARAVSITGVTSGTGGNFTVRGYDVYGNPMSETIACGAGVNTVNGKKAFKFVASVTPAFTDAHNYSVGTADVYGLPLKAGTFGTVEVSFNNVPVTAPTFVAADTTSPATATTGDVRGTVVAASDGTKKLQIMQGVSLADLALLKPGVFTGLFGVAQFTN